VQQWPLLLYDDEDDDAQSDSKNGRNKEKEGQLKKRLFIRGGEGVPFLLETALAFAVARSCVI
jgi:hypothetical protein